MKFLNESRIIEVKQDRNREFPKSNDSASTPDSPLLKVPESNLSLHVQYQNFTNYGDELPAMK